MTAHYGPARAAGKAIYGTTELGILGAVIRATTGTGRDGPGILFNDWLDSSYDTKRFRAVVTSFPAGGYFFFNEDGSVQAPNTTPSGTYSFTYYLELDGVQVGSPVTDTVTINAVASAVQQDQAGAYGVYNAVFQDQGETYRVYGMAFRDLLEAIPVYTRPQGPSVTYTAVAGQGVYAGRAAPPAWLASQPLNTWFQITGTSGAGGAALDNGYSGLAQVGTKWVSLASGGHTTWDNRVTAIDLLQDAPSWSILKAASSTVQDDVAYYSDGKPSGTHVYSSIFALSATKAIRPGSRYTAPNQVSFDTVDAFDLTTNQWDGVVADSPGTSGSGYANVTPSGYFPVAQDHHGDLWCVLHTNGNVAKYTVSTNTWSQPSMTTQISPNVRYPWALDSQRNQLFGLAYGDGEGVGTDLRAVQLDYTVGTQRSISFTSGSSATISQFMADAPQYADMIYDPINDRFLFYSNGTSGRVYVVTPNSGTTWSMSILSSSGSLPVVTAPLVKRLAYFPELRGIACLPSDTGNIYFMRLA